jgi:alpha-N-arabinofuranosidase
MKLKNLLAIVFSLLLIYTGITKMFGQVPVSNKSIVEDVIRMERERVLARAEKMLSEQPVTVTAFHAVRSAGGPHDFYSEGPYWWPDSTKPDGPFIRRDGYRFPGCFTQHDDAVSRLSWIVSTQTSAYLLTGEEKYAQAAMKHLKAWFVDAETKMNANWQYAQAIKGVCTGRGIGLIDAVPLMDVAQSVICLENSPYVSDQEIFQIKEWFAGFLNWMTTHPYGIDEMNTKNNHATWWHAQAAVYARLTGNTEVLNLCRDHLIHRIVPNQMASDGSFPEELARTKPYSYMLFNLDALSILTWVLSGENYDLWQMTLPDGKSVKKAVAYMTPFVKDISSWPHTKDVDGWNKQPGRRAYLLLSALALGKPDLFALWRELDQKNPSEKSIASTTLRSPLLWIGLPDPLASRSYRNPVIPGFNPDPSICRAGDDYYLATSSFEYFPGVPIYHSRDLVHWEMIGHALHRPSQLNLDSVASSGGIYAPTLRYHNGTFYMVTTLTGPGRKDRPRGNFIVTAKIPAGPWSEPHWIEGAPGIDPSLLFDDNGKVYFCGNTSPQTKLWDKHRNIWVQELDLKTWKLVGKRVEILDGGEYYKKGTIDGGIESGVNNFEAPHIYKKDGMYYAMLAHGGTSLNHAVSIWRSKNIFGPYEINPANPILTHRDLSKFFPITSTGHADLVQAKDGRWWMVYLAKRPYGGDNYILGRETFISPVDWNVEWPIVNPSDPGRSKVVSLYPGTLKETPSGFFRDNFDTPVLRKEWTFLRTPRSTWWAVEKGILKIRLRPETLAQPLNSSFIGKRQEHIDCETVVKMTFVPAAENEEAGLAVERDTESYFRFVAGSKDGKNVLRIIRKDPKTDHEEMMNEVAVQPGPVYLKIRTEGTWYRFAFSTNGSTWIPVNDLDGQLLGVSGSGRFTGTFIGMYASSNGKPSGSHAAFDWFEYKGIK